jgi:hypothetical protein
MDNKYGQGSTGATKVKAIGSAVAHFFGMPRRVAPKRKTRAVQVTQQIAMYLMKEMTDASVPENGRYYGNKHSAHVMRSIATLVERRCKRALWTRWCPNHYYNTQSYDWPARERDSVTRHRRATRATAKKGNNIRDWPLSFLYLWFMMKDGDIKENLRGVLGLLRAQAVDLDRHHRWLCAIAETIAADATLGLQLKSHPLYDLGRDPSLRSIEDILVNIDAMLQRLKG